MMPFQRTALVLTLLTAACGSSAPKTKALAAEGGEPPTAATSAPASPYQLPVDVASWQTWTKVNGETFASRSHQKVMVDVFVTKDDAQAYADLQGPMPVGMALVKAQYADDGGQKGAAKNLTVMVKMEPGFDPEHGDWYYGVYSFDGKKAMLEGKSDGKTAMCVNCHDTADVDYVFGTKR